MIKVAIGVADRKQYLWSVDNFGLPESPELASTNSRWEYAAGRYYFHNESDATAFLLRWGGRVM